MIGAVMIVTGFACWPIGYSMCAGHNPSDCNDDGDIFGTITQVVGALLFVAGLALNGWIE
jgi:hypothetical protein